MATQYTELAYRPDPTTGKGQQVYNPTSGKSYSSPTQLAGDLGIQPSAIDWSKIGKSSAGDLASGQQQVQTGVSPVEPGGVSSIDAMLAGYQEQFKQATEAMKTSSENVANAPQFSATDFLQQQTQQAGIPEALKQTNTLIAEANVIRENIAKLEDQKNQEILSMREKGGVSQVTLSARENIAEQKWNSRISAESAKLSGYAATIDALNGNITRAQSFITQAVNAATYDQEQNLNRLTQTYEMNKDLFSSLGSQYQNAFNQAINIKQQELSDAKAEKNKVGTLMINYPNAGITLDMSYEQALQAAQPFEAQKQALDIARTQQLIAGNEEETIWSKDTVRRLLSIGKTPNEVLGSAIVDNMGAEVEQWIKELSETPTATQPQQKGVTNQVVKQSTKITPTGIGWNLGDVVTSFIGRLF